MKYKWSPRPYREGDEAQILELAQSVYGKTGSLEYWNWQFKDNPDGAPILWVAECEGRLVGQYVIIPQRLKVEDQIIMGSLSLDTMTHPDYRRQGIFEVLGRKTYEEARSRGVHITYGLPNQYSYPGFINKLQWFNICQIPQMNKILNLWSVVENLPKVPSLVSRLVGTLEDKIRPKKHHITPYLHLPGVEISRVTSFDDRVDEFWRQASTTRKVMAVRDKRHLNWRYSQKPGDDYVIYQAERANAVLGYIITTVRSVKFGRGNLKAGFIADVLTLPRDEGKAITRALITAAINELRKQQADVVSCCMLKETLYHQVLKRMGFWHRPWLPLGARLNSTKVSKEMLQDHKNWFFTMGDSDAV